MKICPKCGAEYPDTTTLCPSDGIALETNSDELLGQTLAGKYRIDEKLSVGGMGAVYRGTHVLMDKTVAIKVLKPSLAADEKIVARFSREARAASRISHPHAITVTDFGEDENGIVFLVMEHLEGETLKELIRRDGPLPLPRVVEIIRQVGEALDAAHQQGVVHRDLKSDNIMLLQNTATDYAKVLDFGIAKIKEPEGGYDPGLTAPDLVIGTPQYMSPEQCSQAPDIDARSDIYSLGVIIFEMLVGHVPFTGESPTVIMMKHMQQPAPPVSNERPDLPAAVGRVVAKALEKLPRDRYASAAALVEDLSIAAGMQEVARFPTGERVAPAAVGAIVDDDDEETIVRRRQTTPMPRPPAPTPPVFNEPPPVASFNPWKIVVPSLVGLLVIFAAIYAFTRRTTTPTTEAQPNSSLVADPNSQPVEATSPPTGQSEAGIPSGGAVNQNTNANVAASPSPKESPSESETFEPNGNDNANDNSNQRENPPLPSPSRTVTQEAPPPPTPKLPTPRPTLPPPSSPATPQPDGAPFN
ncbi:MAG TPA: serine/threonine-protein kinase [Pyrinomonadaceae bacterium]|nr:serine/threonine-protein kinase [Pyrinomonadaceae bacterium]